MDGFDFEAFAQAMAAAFAADEAAQQETTMPQNTLPVPQTPYTKPSSSLFSPSQGLDALKNAATPAPTDDNETDPRLLFIRPLPLPEAVKENSPQQKKVKTPFPSKKRKAYYLYMRRFITLLKSIEKKVIASEFNNSPLSRSFFDNHFEFYKEAVNQCIIEEAYISSKKGYILVFLTVTFSRLRTKIADIIDTLETLDNKITQVLGDDELLNENDDIEAFANESDSTDNLVEEENELPSPKKFFQKDELFKKTTNAAAQLTKTTKKIAAPAKPQPSPLEKELIALTREIQSIASELFKGTQCPEIKQIIETKRQQRELAEKNTASTVASRKGLPSYAGNSGNSSNYGRYTPGSYGNAYTPKSYGNYGGGGYGGGGYNDYSSGNYGSGYNPTSSNPYGTTNNETTANASQQAKSSEGESDGKITNPATTKSDSTTNYAQVLNCLSKIITHLNDTNNDLARTSSSDRKDALIDLLSSDYFSELVQLYRLMKDSQLKLTKEENETLLKSEDFKKYDLQKIHSTKTFFPHLIEAMTLRTSDNDESTVNDGQAQAKRFAKDFAMNILSSSQHKKFIKDTVEARSQVQAKEFSSELASLTKNNADVDEYDSLADAVKTTRTKFLAPPQGLTDILKKIEAQRKKAAQTAQL